eukprot:m.131018 g.131018  ORF g.131018 m.131018 type:complete len:88 (-) comp13065_c8_seq1:67-330(-)
MKTTKISKIKYIQCNSVNDNNMKLMIFTMHKRPAEIYEYRRYTPPSSSSSLEDASLPYPLQPAFSLSYDEEESLEKPLNDAAYAWSP